MLQLNIKLDGDGILKGFDQKKIITIDKPITVTTLPKGMSSGLPSVSIIIELPDGRKAIAQTSAKLFITAANVILERYKDELVVMWRE